MEVRETNSYIFDVMVGDYYKGTINLIHCPAFRITLDEIKKRVETKFPTLRGKDYRVVPVFDKRDTRNGIK